MSRTSMLRTPRVVKLAVSEDEDTDATELPGTSGCDDATPSCSGRASATERSSSRASTSEMQREKDEATAFVSTLLSDDAAPISETAVIAAAHIVFHDIEVPRF